MDRSDQAWKEGAMRRWGWGIAWGAKGVRLVPGHPVRPLRHAVLVVSCWCAGLDRRLWLMRRWLYAKST